MPPGARLAESEVIGRICTINRNMRMVISRRRGGVLRGCDDMFAGK